MIPQRPSDEVALLLNDEDSPVESTTPKLTLPEAGKTTTTPSKGTDLAAIVDGGNGEVCRDSTPGQGVHVFFTTTAYM